MSKRLSLWAAALSLLLAVPVCLFAQATATPTAPATRNANAEVFPKLPATQPAPRIRADGQPNPSWIRRHEGLAETAKKGDIDIYFLGDSITDFWTRDPMPSRNYVYGKKVWEYYYAPAKAANFGISADNIEHVLYRITNGEFDGVKPKVVVLMIGTNNFGHSPATTPEEVAAGIQHLIAVMHEKSPDTRFLLLGIFPRGRTAADPYRAKIKAANELLAKLDDGQIIKFLDIGEIFLDDRGNLPPTVMPDALHPNEKGYRLWAKAMNPTLFQMLGAPAPAEMPDTPATAPAR